MNMDAPTIPAWLEKMWDETVMLEGDPAPDATLKGMSGRAAHVPDDSETEPVTTRQFSQLESWRAEEKPNPIISSRRFADEISGIPAKAGVAGGVDFTLLGELGRGGMGVVYAARQDSLDRGVAVKMLLPTLQNHPGAGRKMISEALIIGELEHPNIVPIYELGNAQGGGLFYAMKTVKGEPWSRRLAALSRQENLDVLMRVADAVAFAHDHGIIHRDLKPGNVMLGDYGEVLLMDWGLAVGLGPSPRIENLRFDNALAGTPAYMAPEMARGDVHKIGKRSDIYLLGAILHEIVSGVRPHRGANSRECLRAAADNVISPVEAQDDLLEVALRAMATDPDERHSSVKDFQNAVRDVERHREALAMAASAGNSLALAEKNGSYENYVEAVFAYREAARLWPGNSPARAGEREARKKYAACAFAKTDYDLALDNLAGLDDAESASLAEKVKNARREQRLRKRRLRLLGTAAMVLTGLVVATLAVSFLIVTERMKSEQAAREQAKAALVETNEARERESLAAAEREVALRREKEALIRERDALEAGMAAEERAQLEQQRKEAAEREKVELVDAMSRKGRLEDASWWAFAPDVAAERQASAGAGPVELAVPVGGAAMAFRLVPAGEFAMGSNPRSAWHVPDEYLHRVVLGSHFYLGRTEVTRAQWQAVVGVEREEDLLPPYKPSLGQSLGNENEAAFRTAQLAIWGWRTRPLKPGEGELPATGISPEEIDRLFLPAFAAHAPRGWRPALPSEAQWEYAARSGDPGPYGGHASKRKLKVPGWVLENSGMNLRKTGLKRPNAWGFVDMHGNAGEVVRDTYDRDFYLNSPVDDPVNDQPGAFRVYRGGNILHPAAQSLAGSRHRIHRENRYAQIGFRLSLQPE